MSQLIVILTCITQVTQVTSVTADKTSTEAELSPLENYAIIGENITLICDVIDTANWTWLGPDIPLLDKNESMQFFNESTHFTTGTDIDSGAITLTIWNIRHQDAGIYRCLPLYAMSQSTTTTYQITVIG